MTADREKYAVVTDFDGTITTCDIGDALCLHFNVITADDIEASYSSGTPVAQWMADAFARLPADRNVLENFVVRAARRRKGFAEFSSFCKKRGVPVEIASGGVDLYINPILKKWGARHIKALCGTADTSAGVVRVTYPACGGRTVEQFKADRVLAMRERGYKVIFCGDGPSDFPAALAADVAFARLRLYDLCKKRGVAAHHLTDFRRVADIIGQ